MSFAGDWDCRYDILSRMNHHLLCSGSEYCQSKIQSNVDRSYFMYLLLCYFCVLLLFLNNNDPLLKWGQTGRVLY